MGGSASFPKIGLGTALIKDNSGINIVYQSIKDGVRLIDVMPYNEEYVGFGINNAIRDRIVKREDLFIIAKLELDKKEDPELAIMNSLQKLQLTYIDLYLDEWPSCPIFKESKQNRLIPVKETWSKMERLVDSGLTKYIGLSNYNVENIFNVLSICKIKPFAIEVEFNPYLYQEDLKEFCDKEKIKLFAYNPLCKGKYCNPIIKKEKKLDLFKENNIEFLVKEYDKSYGQIILNWHISLGVIPIPGTSNPHRMKENLKSMDFKLKQKYMKLLSFKDKQHRFNNGRDIFGINIFA